MSDDKFAVLRERLENFQEWPCSYMYKFIVPQSQEKIDEVKALFSANAKFSDKQSSTGKYISITIQNIESNADDVINKYIEATKIEGLISL